MPQFKAGKQRALAVTTPQCSAAAPEIHDAYVRLGVTTPHSTPGQVMDRVRAESPVMARTFKAAGVEPE